MDEIQVKFSETLTQLIEHTPRTDRKGAKMREVFENGSAKISAGGCGAGGLNREA